MEHKKKISAKLPLISALLLLEQLMLTTYVHYAKIRMGYTEIGCNSCRLRNIKTIKKVLSDCCVELFYDDVQVEAEIEYNDIVKLVLQAFHSPRLGYVVVQ
jgi:hypothetical protein